MDELPVAIIRVTFDKLSPEIQQVLTLIVFTLVSLNMTMSIMMCSTCGANCYKIYKSYKKRNTVIYDSM
jgi:hypothetical protein